ncbi:efflux RND transporter permease subunit [Limnoglobus roseus]|uniref:AcrB/AcrD/AcrF family protein n=1 Tax=Limnoglobus roseus TaxID=2598579 RepID=A0A5C1AGD5_9BACT|nr:efflux RND transporter permease subunit [Limnoglobus roseus]QEL17207.1 AcrB/AcrD/AcrF family protein [Limnoglobus roseus]
MNISSPFIRRPIMTTLLTLALLLAGGLGYTSLPVNDLPNVDFPTIQVTASLPGANPETMAAAVATPLEREFTAIPGIEGLTSTSVLGVTSITMQFDLSRNIDAAAQDVQSAIGKAARSLPDDMPAPPAFRKVNPSDSPIVLLTLRSDVLPLFDVNEYGETFLAQRMSQINGVAQVTVYGQQKKAVRVQVDPNVLAARGVGLDEISTALQDANVNLPTGTFQGRKQAFNIQATGQLMEAKSYRPVIVAYRGGQPIRLNEVAKVFDGVENDKVGANFAERTPAGEPGDLSRSIMLAVYRQPGANTVEVAAEVLRLIPSFQAQLPPSVTLQILADRSVPIRESIHDVQITLLIAFGLVVLVIFFFLRSARATLIPSLALPVSIVATFGVMHLMCYTLDNLSLLALTLAVGFVVDDAIVMLENIIRHLDMGKPPLRAALDGSAEVGFTIVSMTISLVAVFIPVLFMSGLVGRLLREFAVTISIAIVISGFVSVTLTPMLCALLLRGGHAPHADTRHGLLFRVTEGVFDLFLGLYAWTLRLTIRLRLLMLLFSFAFIAGTVYYLVVLPKGFLPSEDTGQITCTTEGPEDISFQGLLDAQGRVEEILRTDEYVAAFNSTVGSMGFNASANAGRIFIRLTPRDQRDLSADQVIARLRKKTAAVPGIKVFFQNPPPIRIGSRTAKSLYQFTIQGPDTRDLYSGAARLEAKLRAMPELLEVTSDMQLRSPQLNVRINRDRAKSLGVTARQIEDALANAYGSRQVSTIFTPNNEYQVILEVKPEFQENPALLSRLYIRSASSILVPMDSLVTVSRGVGPLTVNHSGQLPSVTISFDLRPGVSLGDVLNNIDAAAREELAPTLTTGFQGTAQEFQKSAKGLGLLLIAAVVVIYIVMGMLYESFVHPVTILSGLPSAGVGALLTLALFNSELNLYSMVGLIMLIGIVKKNAIMMIDFALEAERTQGKSAREAIYEASLVRFRPIMMTTMCALLGALPIALGWGAGAESRKPLGLAVVGGLIVSQVLTLYFTPVYYIYLDKLRFGRRRPAVKTPGEPTDYAGNHSPLNTSVAGPVM